MGSRCRPQCSCRWTRPGTATTFRLLGGRRRANDVVDRVGDSLFSGFNGDEGEGGKGGRRGWLESSSTGPAFLWGRPLFTLWSSAGSVDVDDGARTGG